MMGPKSSVFKTVDFPPGLTELGGVIAFLNDKDAITKTFKKLTDLLTEINTAIEKVGKAETIDHAYNEIQQKYQDADRLLDQAQTKADELTHAATTEANEILESAHATANKLLADAQSKSEQLNEKLTELRAKETALENRWREAQGQANDLTQREAALLAREKEFENIQSILKQLPKRLTE